LSELPLAGQVRERKAALGANQFTQHQQRMVDIEVCFSRTAWIFSQNERIPDKRSADRLAILAEQRELLALDIWRR